MEAVRQRSSVRWVGSVGPLAQVAENVGRRPHELGHLGRTAEELSEARVNGFCVLQLLRPRTAAKRRRQGAAREGAQRPRAARRVHCNRGCAVVHERAGVGERSCDEVVQWAACERRLRAPREPCARTRFRAVVVAGRTEQRARDDTRVWVVAREEADGRVTQGGRINFAVEPSISTTNPSASCSLSHRRTTLQSSRLR